MSLRGTTPWAYNQEDLTLRHRTHSVGSNAIVDEPNANGNRSSLQVNPEVISAMPMGGYSGDVVKVTPSVVSMR